MNDAIVKDICQAWAQAGYGDECFWEHWSECPTEETLTPNMLLACLETQAAEIERLRGDLAKAVEAGKTMDDGCDCERCSKARTTLAELTGAKDE